MMVARWNHLSSILLGLMWGWLFASREARVDSIRFDSHEKGRKEKRTTTTIVAIITVYSGICAVLSTDKYRNAKQEKNAQE